MKNVLNGFINNLESVEKKISKLEAIEVETTQSETWKEKILRKWKNRDWVDNIKQLTYIQFEYEGDGGQKIFEEIRAKNLQIYKT